jgi:hypothetical protein
MAQVLVPLQRFDRGPPRIEFPAFSLDDVSFDEPLAAELPPPPPVSFPDAAPAEPGPPRADRNGGEEQAAPNPVAEAATTAGIAYITVSDSSGRVLFRRPATGEEVEEALRAADEAEREGQEAMERIAAERFYKEALEDTSR